MSLPLTDIASQPDLSWLASFMEKLHPAAVTDLRWLSLDDLPSLLFLERYCFNPCLAFGQKRWRYLLTRSVCRTIGVFHHEQLIAYLCLLPHQGWQAVEIRSLAVHWSYREQGIGHWLLQIAKAQSANWMLDKICLSVDCENTAALCLYPTIGILLASYPQPHYYGLERHAVRQRYWVAIGESVP